MCRPGRGSQATGLAAIADGRGHLERELQHWSDEMRRVQRGPLPALERLGTELCERKPEPCPTVTLVHGERRDAGFETAGAAEQVTGHRFR